MKQLIDEQFLQQMELFTLSVKDNVAGLFGGNHKSKKYGSSCEFADYRDYLEGDDITKIDWNLYGKFEKMYLKLYLDERQMKTRIYIDCSTSMSYFNKGRMAVQLAYVLSYLSVLDMDKVSVYAIRGDTLDPILENLIGRDAFLSQISKLNDVKFEGSTHISDAIVRSTVGYGDGRSIILSDFETDNDFNDAVDYLRSKRRDVLCMQILGEEEIHPNFHGKTIIHDSENDYHFYKNNITRDVISAYHKALDFTTHRIESFCASREADFVQVSAEDSMRDIFLKKMVERGIIQE